MHPTEEEAIEVIRRQLRAEFRSEEVAVTVNHWTLDDAPESPRELGAIRVTAKDGQTDKRMPPMKLMEDDASAETLARAAAGAIRAWRAGLRGR